MPGGDHLLGLIVRRADSLQARIGQRRLGRQAPLVGSRVQRQAQRGQYGEQDQEHQADADVPRPRVIIARRSLPQGSDAPFYRAPPAPPAGTHNVNKFVTPP